MKKLALFGFLILTVCNSIHAADANMKIDDLNWISGHWTGELWGGNLEEIWTKPGGDCMMGMFRFIKDNKVQFYEFITIEQEADGLKLRLKHFNRGLKGWEEKDESLLFLLVSVSPNEAVFERQDKIDARMIFRTKDPETMIVSLEGVKDGKPDKEEFIYQRK